MGRLSGYVGWLMLVIALRSVSASLCVSVSVTKLAIEDAPDRALCRVWRVCGCSGSLTLGSLCPVSAYVRQLVGQGWPGCASRGQG